VDQFTRLRDGDRFWYQNSLSEKMVRDVQNTSLADVIRRNTELTKLQADVFFFNESTTVMLEAAPETQNGQQPQNGQQGNGQQNGHQLPQAAMDACANLVENSSCSFIGRNQNTVSGTCGTPPNSTQLACMPANSQHKP
jgi:hypothetical protein